MPFLCMLPLLTLSPFFLSVCIAQDGFTWWVNPNSTAPITYQQGQNVTLRWVTDFPEFNIVLYQNLGDGYGDFVSEFLLEQASGINSYDWLVAPIQGSSMSGNLSCHFDLILYGDDTNGANSDEFLIQLNGNSSSPTSSFPLQAYPTASTSATVYLPYPYSFNVTKSLSSVTFNNTSVMTTTTTSASIRAPTAAGGSVTVSTRSYSSTAAAAQQTVRQSTAASGPTTSASTGEGTRDRNRWGLAVIAAIGGVIAAF